MVEFLELESQDGVRMPWNMIPGTKQESSNCVVLVFAIYSPIRPLPNITLLPSFPLCCRTCCFVLDPFAIVDFAAKIWICPFCFQCNHFPPNYTSISDDNLPAELFPHYTTIEYSQDNQIDQSPPQLPLVFLFMINSYLIEEEMGFLKSPIYKLRAS